MTMNEFNLLFPHIPVSDYRAGDPLESLVKKKPPMPNIDRVIFNPPATVIIWSDGTKTVVKCGADETYDKYCGFCVAVCKKLFGSTSKIKSIIENRGVEQ